MTTEKLVPSLSVVVSLREPWPAAQVILETLLPQARAIGGEVVLPISDERAIPQDVAEQEGIVIVRLPGASHFDLRAAGIAASRADIVALTEEHCTVSSNWCAAVLEAHRQYPGAAAIGGVVENGSAATLLDRAAFLAVQAAFLRPLPCGPAPQIALQANVSYKRSLLPPHDPALGHCEFYVHQALRRRGATLVADDRMIVAHVQSLGLRGFVAVHFHNGRGCTGLLAPEMPLWRRIPYAAWALLLPALLTASTLRAALRKRSGIRETLEALPVVAILHTSAGLGQAAGYLFGGGDSARRID